MAASTSGRNNGRVKFVKRAEDGVDRDPEFFWRQRRRPFGCPDLVDAGEGGRPVVPYSPTIYVEEWCNQVKWYGRAVFDAKDPARIRGLLANVVEENNCSSRRSEARISARVSMGQSRKDEGM
jgi:hypothetical protein